MGISKRGASVGTHEDKDLEQERSPDGRLRGSQGIRMHQGVETGAERGAGVARTREGSPPHLAGPKGSRKIRCAEPKNESTLLILVVAGNHPRPPVHVVQSKRGMSFQSFVLQMRMLSHGILIMGSTSRAGGLRHF